MTYQINNIIILLLLVNNYVSLYIIEIWGRILLYVYLNVFLIHFHVFVFEILFKCIRYSQIRLKYFVVLKHIKASYMPFRSLY